jgi:hypothetical protein
MEMRTIIILAIILAVCASIGIYISQNFKQIFDFVSNSVEGQCNSGKDCAWIITNCCPENAGARWECVKVKDYESRGCMQKNICPQVLSPRPNAVCVCSDGKCVGVNETKS